MRFEPSHGLICNHISVVLLPHSGKFTLHRRPKCRASSGPHLLGFARQCPAVFTLGAASAKLPELGQRQKTAASVPGSVISSHKELRLVEGLVVAKTSRALQTLKVPVGKSFLGQPGCRQTAA